MTKPDFKQMTRKELKRYILTYPTDDEAIRELFINRWDKTKAKSFPSPVEMSKQELDDLFRQQRQ
jgi:hypothetical protein